MPFEPVSFEGNNILITGATGMVSRPLVRAYSKAGKVYAMARYARADSRSLPTVRIQLAPSNESVQTAAA
jgi:nucleoside-diphosphate-sugar epimerase